MATQLAEAPADAGGEGNNNAIDYEIEARKIGWTPPEEFKGDPTKAVDAKTFYERGQELMPLLKAQNRDLLKRIDKLEKDRDRSADFFSKAEERAYERAKGDIKREMAEAVESGDQKAADAALDKLDKLEKPNAAPKADTLDESQRAEEFADWVKANRWYADNDAIRAYADAQAERIAKGKGGTLDLSDLREVAELTKAKFEDAFPDAFGSAPKPKPRNPVDAGGNAPPRRNGRTFADLPADAQRVCDKWVANGTIKSREDYVKNYEF